MRHCRLGGVQRLPQYPESAVQPQICDCIRSTEAGILPHGLALLAGLADDVEQIVRHLVGRAELLAHHAPGRLFRSRRRRTKGQGRLEEGARLRLVVANPIDPGLRLPGLAGHDPARHPHPGGEDPHHRQRPSRMPLPRCREEVEGMDDQRVPREHSEGLAELGVDAGSPPPLLGVVKARQIVVNQAGAVEELHRRGRCFDQRIQRWPGAAGLRGDEGQERTNPPPAGEDRVLDGRLEATRRPMEPVYREGFSEGDLNSGAEGAEIGRGHGLSFNRLSIDTLCTAFVNALDKYYAVPMQSLLAARPHLPGLPLDLAVPTNGYAWWYLDVLDPQGVWGLTVIFFVGSVFSPRYRSARLAGSADPFDHCAVNVCLYGPQGRWVFTERPAPEDSPKRRSDAWQLGQSRISWEGETLVVDLEEWAAPGGGRVAGRVELTPELRTEQPIALDVAGRHLWWPIAPRAQARVRLTQPAVSFDGAAYHDANWGEEPLEEAFSGWTWSRARTPEGVLLQYDTTPREGPPIVRTLAFEPGGEAIAPPLDQQVSLGRSRFLIPRQVRSDAPARLIRSLEDSPFYHRSEIAFEQGGRMLVGMHEGLDLDRFVHPVVQRMLPFRIRQERQ